MANLSGGRRRRQAGGGRRGDGADRIATGRRRVAPERDASGRSNSVARRLPAGRGVRRRLGSEEGARVARVLADRGGECGERVVARFVAQFVQQFHAHESTVAPLAAERRGPIEAMHLEQDAAAVVDRRPLAEAGDAGDAARAPRPWTRTTKMPIAAGFGWPKRRLSVRKPSPRPAPLSPRARPRRAPWTTRPLMLYGRPSSAAASAMSPAASAARTAELETRRPCTS